MVANRIAPSAPVQARRAATFEPTSYNAADNSIDLVWTTGAAVTRADWFTGEFYTEVLSTDPARVRLDRLNAGAPFLDSHREGDLAAVLGSVVPGSARVADGQGTCRVRLAETPDVADQVAKIKAGHIRNTSVGYSVFTFERTERPGEYPVMTAIDWEPREISAVTVPADPHCQIRSEPSMTDATVTAPNAEATTTDARAAGRYITATRISEACSTACLDDPEELRMLREHAATPYTEARLTQRITEAYAERNNPPSIDNSRTTPAYTARQGSPEALRQRMAGAIQARLSGSEPAAESREFMGATMIDLARGLLVARGERAQYLSPAAVFERSATMTTSDFPQLLAGPMGAYLNELYRLAPPPLQVVARSRTTRDFKPITGLRLDGDDSLPFIAENGEYTYAAFNESGQQYRVNTFGKIFSLSRQAMINDNLGMYAQMSAQFVRRASTKRADILAAVLNTNLAILDLATNTSLPLFHVSRGNLAAVGSELSVESLSAARLAMRSQRDRSGVLDVTPKYLVVGSELETRAEQVLAALAAATVTDVNPFAGKLILVVDPRLIGRAWYLFADPAQHAVLEYATLEGQDDVFTDTRLNWSPEQLETKVRIDFGAAAVDGVGAYKNPGN